METLELGFYETDITPVKPVQTIGFGREDQWSRGILQNLAAQVTIWRLGAYVCCLAAIDHIGFSKQHSDHLRGEIGRLLSIEKEQVMLCFSHTHSAPNDSIETEYFHFVCGQVKQGVSLALQNMKPVKTAWGNAYADIGVNRRPNCQELDRRIGILQAVQADSGQPCLLLLRLTAHANSLKADNYLISPDYFGAVRSLLRDKYGCPVLLTQGASGNVAPKYYKSSYIPIDCAKEDAFYRSETALEDMAGEIYRQVNEVIPHLQPQKTSRLSLYSITRCFHAAVPSYERAFQIAREAKENANIDGTAWLREVERLQKEGIQEQTEPIEIQYFAVGDGCLCGTANELMCEFALRAEKQTGSSHFYLGGYTNGCAGYFPTEEEYDLGGYEVYWSMLTYFMYYGRVFPLNRDSAAKLVREAVQSAPPDLKQS